MRSGNTSQYFDIAVLGLLDEEPQHGYEIHRRILASFETLFQPSWGSLYPALSRLEKSGLIETAHSSSDRIAIPTTGSLGGEIAVFKSFVTPSVNRRQRKAYSISKSGRVHLIDLLSRIEVEDDRTFWVSLAFSEKLSQLKQASMLDRRKYVLEDRLRSLKESQYFGTSGSRAMAVQGLVEKLSSEISWIGSVSNALRETNFGHFGGSSGTSPGPSPLDFE